MRSIEFVFKLVYKMFKILKSVRHGEKNRGKSRSKNIEWLYNPKTNYPSKALKYLIGGWRSVYSTILLMRGTSTCGDYIITFWPTMTLYLPSCRQNPLCKKMCQLNIFAPKFMDRHSNNTSLKKAQKITLCVLN